MEDKPITMVLLEALHRAEPQIPGGEALERWHAATEELLYHVAPARRRAAAGILSEAWAFGEAYRQNLEGTARAEWPARMRSSLLVRHHGPESLEQLLVAASDPVKALEDAAIREIQLETASLRSDAELRDLAITDTTAARALIALLRDVAPSPLGERVRRLFPELAALSAEADHFASLEQEPSRDRAQVPARPLLDHLDRALSRKLLGLEKADLALFQRQPALSASAFQVEVERLRRIESKGVLPAIRAALLHLDFAKGGTPEDRERWRNRTGADLSVHNLAARTILERGRVLAGFFWLAERPSLEGLCLALVESHGLAGQAVRGETPLVLFAPFVAYLRSEAKEALADGLKLSGVEAVQLAVDCLHLINVVDTAAVREGLMSDALRDGLDEIARRITGVALAGSSTDRRAIEAELMAAEDAQWLKRLPEASPLERNRARLSDRLCRLRQGRQASGEPRSEVERAVAAVPEASLEALLSRMACCQFWYAEAATAGLSPGAQLKLLALGMRAGDARPKRPSPSPSAPTSPARPAPFNVNLLPLVKLLHPGVDRAVGYRLRLIETLLDPIPVAQILEDGPAALPSGLGTFDGEIGGSFAVSLHFAESAETEALLVLLPIYEQKSSAAFHSTLKTLCDAYGLRKDEFDRVANENAYLVHMNSAKNDKARMLEYVRPGRIVEVGPGGGVVLDLLEERFATSGEVIGIDTSRMVIEALERRRQAEGRRWRLIEADAFELPKHVGESSVDSVVFCSVLHEIYSYGRFHLEAVRDLLRAAYRSLVPGGRIVIRDGVMPPAGDRILHFVAPDARGFFELFAKQFEGRTVRFEPGPSPAEVALSSADAMEFLYKYTWGPESFPYEIREQYGVLPYEEYSSRILEWLEGVDFKHPPRVLPLPPEVRTYLQPGYVSGLAGKVELFDAAHQPVRLPDSNCLMVFEKT
jgi:SAM-dependent methyltransferase